MKQLLYEVSKFKNCLEIRPVNYLVQVLQQSDDIQSSLPKIKRSLIVMRHFTPTDVDIQKNWTSLKDLIQNFIKEHNEH